MDKTSSASKAESSSAGRGNREDTARSVSGHKGKDDSKVLQPFSISGHSHVTGKGKDHKKTPQPFSTSGQFHVKGKGKDDNKAPQPPSTSGHSQVTNKGKDDNKAPQSSSTSGHSHVKGKGKDDNKAPQPSSISGHSQVTNKGKDGNKAPQAFSTSGHSHVKGKGKDDNKAPQPSSTSGHSQLQIRVKMTIRLPNLLLLVDTLRLQIRVKMTIRLPNVLLLVDTLMLRVRVKMTIRLPNGLLLVDTLMLRVKMTRLLPSLLLLVDTLMLRVRVKMTVRLPSLLLLVDTLMSRVRVKMTIRLPSLLLLVDTLMLRVRVKMTIRLPSLLLLVDTLKLWRRVNMTIRLPSLLLLVDSLMLRVRVKMTIRLTSLLLLVDTLMLRVKMTIRLPSLLLLVDTLMLRVRVKMTIRLPSLFLLVNTLMLRVKIKMTIRLLSSQLSSTSGHPHVKGNGKDGNKAPQPSSSVDNTNDCAARTKEDSLPSLIKSILEEAISEAGVKEITVEFLDSQIEHISQQIQLIQDPQKSDANPNSLVLKINKSFSERMTPPKPGWVPEIGQILTMALPRIETTHPARLHFVLYYPGVLHDFHSLGCTQKIEKSVMDEILETAKGVPLILKVIGQFLGAEDEKKEAYRIFKEERENWSGQIFDPLDRLDINMVEDLKDPFLDICSFFDGWYWQPLADIVGISTLDRLQKKGLLIKDRNSRVTVHEVFLIIGLEKSKGTRIMDANEISQLDTKGIKGLWFTTDQGGEPIPAKKLDQVAWSLRILALQNLKVEGDYNKNFLELIYLDAGGSYRNQSQSFLH